MQVFNPKNLRNNQRFPFAIAVGVLAGVVSSLIYAVFEILTGFQFSLEYLLGAVLISYAIKHYGRGVDQKFQIAAVLIFVGSIFLGDLIQLIYFTMQGAHQSVFALIPTSFYYTLESFTHLDYSGLFRLAVVGYGGYVAYFSSTIL